MAVTWVDGELNGIDIEWLSFETICEVDNDKELLRTRVTAETSGFSGYCYFDNLQLLKNLTDEKITGNEVTYIPLDEVSTGNEIEMPVFGAVTDVQIVSAHIVPKTTITGNDSNYMALKIINKETDAVICTKTFIAGADATAYQVTDFGPVNEGNGAISEGYGVSLVKEETGAGMLLPDGILIIQWNLR